MACNSPAVELSSFSAGAPFSIGISSLASTLPSSTPLVETVDSPDRPLNEDLVFVERDQPTEAVRVEPAMKDRRRRTVARKGPVRRQPVDFPRGLPRPRHFRPRLRLRPPESQRATLRQAIREEKRVMVAERLAWLDGGDELHGDHVGALMQKLEKGMLGVGSRFAPDHRPGRPADRLACQRHALAVRFHVELLNIGREPLQPLIVGDERDGGPAHAAPPEEPDQPQKQGQIALRRRGQEMPVHRRRALEERPEPLRPDGDGQRQADRRPDRIASADPVPEAEDAALIDAKLRGPFQIGGDRRQMRPMLDPAGGEPFAHRARVGHRLLRREGLGGDHRHRRLRVEPGQHVGQVRAIDIGDEMHTRPVMIRPERPDGHDRAEVGAADADIDDIGKPPARRRRKAAGAHVLREGQESLPHLVHLGRGVVDGAAERHVPDGAALGLVDRLTPNHRIPPRRDAARFGQRQQRPKRARVDLLLREIDQQVVEPEG